MIFFKQPNANSLLKCWRSVVLPCDPLNPFGEDLNGPKPFPYDVGKALAELFKTFSEVDRDFVLKHYQNLQLQVDRSDEVIYGIWETPLYRFKFPEEIFNARVLIEKSPNQIRDRLEKKFSERVSYERALIEHLIEWETQEGPRPQVIKRLKDRLKVLPILDSQ